MSMSIPNGFGRRRIENLLPPSLRENMGDDSGHPEAAVPRGASGIERERDDQVRSGDFRSRYEHISRYSEASGTRWGVVADIGCGTGYGSAQLRQLNQVVGIDISTDALVYAREHYGGSDFVQGSAQSIPLADGVADAVTAFEVLEHVKDPELLVEECHRILRKGGRLFISSPNPAHFANVVKHHLLRRRIPLKVDPNNPYHLREFSNDEFRSVLISKGFEIILERGQTLPVDLIIPMSWQLRTKLIEALGLHEIYDWVLSRLGEKFPRYSWTVVICGRRL